MNKNEILETMCKNGVIVLGCFGQEVPYVEIDYGYAQKLMLDNPYTVADANGVETVYITIGNFVVHSKVKKDKPIYDEGMSGQELKAFYDEVVSEWDIIVIDGDKAMLKTSKDLDEPYADNNVYTWDYGDYTIEETIVYTDEYKMVSRKRINNK